MVLLQYIHSHNSSAILCPDELIFRRADYDIFISPRCDLIRNHHSSGLSEESNRKCRELCEEMSALKASNESEVKALKAQLKSVMDSMQTMAQEINDLNQKLSTCDNSEQMSAMKASNECEMKTLRAQINTSGDSMQTMAEDINDLQQKLSTLDK
ncbi:unnamed protein product, partial [Medioppia subpectinata]